MAVTSRSIFAVFSGARHYSSQRWLVRQTKDPFTKQAKQLKLKSRAAFKLLEIDEDHKIFKKGDTVVDLGYAPGSWSQVAIDRVSPGGRVVGLDIIPAPPPKGVSTLQGNFLDPKVQQNLREFLSDPDRGRLRVPQADKAYIDFEREETEGEDHASKKKCVQLVLSDMCEPWESFANPFIRSLTEPYRRLMNTSGIRLRDHAGSMDLCNAALLFCLDVLKTGGHFVCKFYQGSEDKELEQNLKKVFKHVHKQKPESSRKDSKEAYFIAMHKLPGVSRATLEPPASV
ncbi:FtsJ-like methyltransferase-domain-containing protein [Sphaerosporella brunnea]|uniref:rRNA methyltransferase 2, mitochondrial n=1 Tax=Sphaerosporella brunnea TaxID=1250544 RepID=A0A5J5EPF8_9PEZI|nr:FtsJ-like methyltransferase-domain-containing protein [Sphaerosporella brunnea]